VVVVVRGALASENIFERYRRDWDVNARVDPMWSVLSLAEKMGGGWDESDFYKTGEQEIGEIFRFMAALLNLWRVVSTK
jgi:hypothetical protein